MLRRLDDMTGASYVTMVRPLYFGALLYTKLSVPVETSDEMVV